jgi:hypothetical protein
MVEEGQARRSEARTAVAPTFTLTSRRPYFHPKYSPSIVHFVVDLIIVRTSGLRPGTENTDKRG